MASQQSSYSALGAYYDYLYTTARKQGKKHGAKAAPVTRELNGDDFVEALSYVGAVTGAIPALDKAVDEMVFSWINVKLGNQKDKPSVGSTKMTYGIPEVTIDIKDSAGSVIAAESDGYKLGGGGFYAGMPVDITKVPGIITDPNKFIDTQINNWIGARQAERTARLVGGLMNKAVEAVTYSSLRSAGVQSDIAVLVSESRNEFERELSPFSNEPKKSGSLSTLVVIESINAPAIFRPKRGAFVDQATMCAMLHSGFVDKKDRDSFFGSARGIFRETFAANPNWQNVDSVRTAFLSTIDGKMRGASTAEVSYLRRMRSFVSSNRFDMYWTDVSDTLKVGPENRSKMIQGALNIYEADLSAIGKNGEARAIGHASNLMGKASKDLTAGYKYAYYANKWRSAKILSEISFWGVLGTGESIKSITGLLGFHDFTEGIDTDRCSRHISTMVKKYDSVKDTFAPWGTIGVNPFTGDNKKMFGLSNVPILSLKANGLQKMFYTMYIFHPWQFINGVLNGSLPYRLLMLGSKHGYLAPSQWKWYAKFGNWMLNRKLYMASVKIFQTAQYTALAPLFIAKRIYTQTVVRFVDFIKDKVERAVLFVVEKALSVFMKEGAKILVKRIGDVLTGGVFAVYDIVNFLTFGILDKAIAGILKFIFKVVAFILMTIVVMALWGAFGIQAIVSNNASSTVGDIGGGSFYAPDPDFVPREYTGEGGSEDWDPNDYAEFKKMACPWEPSSACTQGPLGAGTHACKNPGLYALDINAPDAPNDTGYVYSPEPGWVIEWSHYGDTSYGNFCKGEAGWTVIYLGVSGTKYKFVHMDTRMIPKESGSTSGTPQVKSAGVKLAHIGDFTNICEFKGGSTGKCSCWYGTHIHAEVFREGESRDEHPDVVYGEMCVDGTYSCAGNNSLPCP